MGASDQPPGAPMRGPSRWRTIAWKVLAAAVAVGALFLLVRRVDVTPALRLIEEQGAWAPVIFGGIYVLFTVLLVPGSVLTLGAGALFGLGWGTLYAMVASNVAANVAFGLARFAARGKVERMVSARPRFAAIDKAVGIEGWKLVVLLRLSPVIPFTIINYALGITRIGWGHYALASLAGMLPGTFMYVYLGHAIGDAVLRGGAHEKTTVERVALWLGVAATVVVTVFITRLATRALRSRFPGEGGVPEA